MRDQAAWRENGQGLTGSLLLHGLALGLWLNWSLVHPAPTPPPLKAMLVDLVQMPVIAPGPAGGTPRQNKPRPAIAPRVVGVRPEAATPVPDELEARIARMAQLQAPASALPAPDNDGAAYGSGSGGGYALADFVRAQILRRWWPELTSDAARGVAVGLSLKMTRAGVISDVIITDQQRFNTDKQFRGMALSARNAAMLASPIALPPGRYDSVMTVSISLDPKAVLR